MFSRLPVLRKSFFLQFGDLENWSRQEITVKGRNNRNVQIQIPKPDFRVYEFKDGSFEETQIDRITELFPVANINPRVCKNKSKQNLKYLEKYEKDSIAATYASRYFLDISLSEVKKGMIDFDGIIDNEGTYTVIETKEKEALKNGVDRDKWLFGWDSRRISWYLYLKDQIQLDSLYLIREVNNQTSRRLIAWKKISLMDFCDCASWLSEYGGGGGSGTITAPYLKFSKL